ncbi:MAG: hypothetical protein IJ250_03280 [Bacteroidales bacterium]|nr:hypothetical protein [Bacteroidales bacterium]
MKAINRRQIPELDSEPFTIIAIVTHEPFYYTCGCLHRMAGLQFKRVRDFGFYDEQQETLNNVPTAMFQDETNGLLYIMMDNTLPVIPQLKTPKRLLVIIGRDCEKQSSLLVKNMRTVNGILTSKVLYPEKEELKYSAKPQCVQADLFSQDEEDVYQRVKRKRKKPVFNPFDDDKIMENLKSDLQINLYEQVNSAAGQY